MNRRDFFAKLLVAQTAFMVLPAARTYRRTWRMLLCPHIEEELLPGTCTNVFDAFRMATESLNDEIYRRAYHKSPWIKLIQDGHLQTDAGLIVPSNELVNGESAWRALIP